MVLTSQSLTMILATSRDTIFRWWQTGALVDQM